MGLNSVAENPSAQPPTYNIYYNVEGINKKEEPYSSDTTRPYRTDILVGKGINLHRCHFNTDDHVSNQMLQKQDKEKINQVVARGLLNN